MQAVASAASWAEAQVSAVSEDPRGRVELVRGLYQGPLGDGPRHLPYQRAAMSFMRWQLRRGLLAPAQDTHPGSPWWKAINARLISDGWEAVALSSGASGPPSSRAVDYWLAFVERPTARAWYRAHNASVVGGYLQHRQLAEQETAAERFFMNVVLCRVLYAHALVAAPKLSLGWLRPLAPMLGDPRLGMAGIFLQLSRVLPDEYPLVGDVGSYLTDELGFGRLLDHGLILPRLQQVYEWSASELCEPALLGLTCEGAMTYAWPLEDREVWRSPRSLLVPLARIAIPA